MTIDPYFTSLLAPFRSARASEIPTLIDSFWALPAAYTPPEVTTIDQVIAGPHGPIPVRTYIPPHADSPQEALLWIHGGAFVSGDLDVPEADAAARAICLESNALVISADYHLAGPATRYPVPHHDVLAAWHWARSEAGHRGLTPERLALGGASAGANLAAGAALHLRDAGERLPSALILIYPTVHATAQEYSPELTAKVASIPAALRCPPPAVEAMTAAYLGPRQLDIPPHAMPGHAELDGLPRTLVTMAEYDDLRASAEAFCASLRRSAVPVRSLVEPGTLHGYLAHPLSLAFARTVSAIAEHLASH